ncbi:histidine kinase dimerization/phospho-acceptor domain-containing protein [Marinilabilia rubra]|uniref:histidine kinase n=1 Tax=Marinilabilia rubra TaxID=2162893 RepID=A0A2U2B5C2_9BACT|nr:histidine kinase dimerization/phospho-acceptor domain-containing protein [Marinilabilia rubra]PWD98255.1 hypothetical protein DDZ16_16620 [Marinilabilia rubra]
MSEHLNSFENQIPHELRTPLNVIMGLAELMTLDSDPLERDSQYAKIILSAANELLSSINQYEGIIIQNLKQNNKTNIKMATEIMKNKDT